MGRVIDDIEEGTPFRGLRQKHAIWGSCSANSARILGSIVFFTGTRKETIIMRKRRTFRGKEDRILGCCFKVLSQVLWPKDFAGYSQEALLKKSTVHVKRVHRKSGRNSSRGTTARKREGNFPSTDADVQTDSYGQNLRHSITGSFRVCWDTENKTVRGIERHEAAASKRSKKIGRNKDRPTKWARKEEKRRRRRRPWRSEWIYRTSSE